MKTLAMLFVFNFLVAARASAAPIIVAQCENQQQKITFDLGSQLPPAIDTGYSLDVNDQRNVGTIVGFGELISAQNGVYVFNLKASLSIFRIDKISGGTRAVTLPSNRIWGGLSTSRITIDVNRKTAFLQLNPRLSISLTCSNATAN